MIMERLQAIQGLIGNTPLLKLDHEYLDLYCKLEFLNFSGSVKIRAAYYMLQEAIKRGDITTETTVIESSSGNMAIALATLCKRIGIKFIPVIDPNINPSYERVLSAISHDIIKVTERDETGGYLLTRIKTVKKLLKTLQPAFWTNQYENPDNYYSHYYGLGNELAAHFNRLDYVFIGVSSGGTITGVSRRLKERFPNIRIVAVDTEGSVIFGQPPKKRFIPGIGSSMRPPIMKQALIDEVIHVPEPDTIEGCHQLFERYGLFVGGSSGTSFKAIEMYFHSKMLTDRTTVAFLCPDGGMPYADTIFNDRWAAKVRAEYSTYVSELNKV